MVTPSLQRALVILALVLLDWLSQPNLAVAPAVGGGHS